MNRLKNIIKGHYTHKINSISYSTYVFNNQYHDIHTCLQCNEPILKQFDPKYL